MRSATETSIAVLMK